MKQIVFAVILIFVGGFTVFAQSDANKCPEIKFVAPKEIINPENPTFFIVEVGENNIQNDLQYEWKFSLRKLLSGQGTSKVEFVASEEENGANVTVSVKVTGLPKNCSDTYSDVYGIAALIEDETFDDFGKVSLDHYKSRIDTLWVTIANNPNSEGLIHQMFDEKAMRAYKISLLRNIVKFLIFREYDLTRISFAICKEDSSKERTLFWVPVAGGKYPKYIKANCEVIKANEFEKRVNDLFPKTGNRT